MLFRGWGPSHSLRPLTCRRSCGGHRPLRIPCIIAMLRASNPSPAIRHWSQSSRQVLADQVFSISSAERPAMRLHPVEVPQLARWAAPLRDPASDHDRFSSPAHPSALSQILGVHKRNGDAPERNLARPDDQI